MYSGPPRLSPALHRHEHLGISMDDTPFRVSQWHGIWGWGSFTLPEKSTSMGDMPAWSITHMRRCADSFLFTSWNCWGVIARHIRNGPWFLGSVSYMLGRMTCLLAPSLLARLNAWLPRLFEPVYCTPQWSLEDLRSKIWVCLAQSQSVIAA